MIVYIYVVVFFFFFNDTATTEIYTLSLHDALPILVGVIGQVVMIPVSLLPTFLGGVISPHGGTEQDIAIAVGVGVATAVLDRKSTRLNSSHANISYAVFCLKKKNKSYLISASVSTI